jgi:penicillin-binding protein 2
MTETTRNPGGLVESRTGFDPRIIAFHGLIAVLLAVLACGLVYQQIIKGAIHHEQERLQNERRVIVPGPRGDIFDRNGRKLVENRSRFAVVLYLDELRQEFRQEYIRIRNNYRASGDQDLPTSAQLERLARVSVVQRYMDQVNAMLGRTGSVDGGATWSASSCCPTR